jgi:uncharacterized protein (TIGR00369 family)
MTREEAQALLDTIELHRTLGLELTQWGDGAVAFSFAPPAFVREPASGGVHGGALATALDTAACFAVIARVGVDCSTVDLRLDYVRPALDEAFVVRGSVLRAGRRLAWGDATLETCDGRVIATARGTFTW